MVVALMVSAIATFSFWGVARSLPALVFFALLYGFFCAGYTAMWARMVTAVSDEPAASKRCSVSFAWEKVSGTFWQVQSARAY